MRAMIHCVQYNNVWKHISKVSDIPDDFSGQLN